MSLSHPFTAVDVAQSYLDNVFKLHGWPKSIVSDRDPIFLYNFWKGLFSIHGTEFKLSSSYHPQTDGQSGVVNKCLDLSSIYVWGASERLECLVAYCGMVVQYPFSRLDNSL